jgi:hypothetical protein
MKLDKLLMVASGGNFVPPFLRPLLPRLHFGGDCIRRLPQRLIQQLD